MRLQVVKDCMALTDMKIINDNDFIRFLEIFCKTGEQLFESFVVKEIKFPSIDSK